MKITCPKCQMEYELEPGCASNCMCGHAVKAPAADKPAAPVATKLIACPTCGCSVSRNAAACPECGEVINVQMQKPSGAINLRDPVHLIGVILAAIIVLGVIAAAIIKVLSLSEI